MSEQKPEEKPGGGKIVIPNVPLEEFERAVYTRQHEVAGRMLVDVLARFRVGAEIIGYNTSDETKNVLYTRMAACLTALVSDPSFQVSQEGFDRIGAEHATVDSIFRASAFLTSDHLARQFSEWNPASPAQVKFLNSPNLGKFLLVYSLSSMLRMDLTKLFSKDPRASFPLYVGMLSHISTLSEPAHVRREFLLTQHEIFDKVSITDHMLLPMSDAYMYTSYATHPRKHAAKATLNSLTKRLLNRLTDGAASRPLEPTPPRKKPVVLVALEWWTSLHAMFRCFAPVVEQLKTKYHVIGMGRNQEVDDDGRAIFDEFIEIPEKTILKDIIEQIRTAAPDIMFYPSVGMSFWWMAMSTLRLAPIQILGVGHPATTMSPEMDYVVVEEDIIGDVLMSEIIIEVPTGATRFVMRNDCDVSKLEQSTLQPIDNVYHVAVPAMAAKINRPFVQALHRIKEAVPDRNLHFHFFSNTMGLTRYTLDKELKMMLGANVTTHGRLTYDEYCSYLRKCVIHLSPFPFGGTNSNIDSMLHGLPIIALKGEEPHATSDAQMLSRINIEGTVATDTDGYVHLAVAHLLSDDLRAKAGAQMRTAPIQKAFFGPGDADIRTAWVDTFQYLQREHGRLMRMRPRRVRMEDR